MHARRELIAAQDAEYAEALRRDAEANSEDDDETPPLTLAQMREARLRFYSAASETAPVPPRSPRSPRTSRTPPASPRPPTPLPPRRHIDPADSILPTVPDVRSDHIELAFRAYAAYDSHAYARFKRRVATVVSHVEVHALPDAYITVEELDVARTFEAMVAKRPESPLLEDPANMLALHMRVIEALLPVAIEDALTRRERARNPQTRARWESRANELMAGLESQVWLQLFATARYGTPTTMFCDAHRQLRHASAAG